MGIGTTAYWAGIIAAKKYVNKVKAKDAERKAETLPKEFEYYCPGCLFQTNEYSKVCPGCRQYKLEKTAR